MAEAFDRQHLKATAALSAGAFRPSNTKSGGNNTGPGTPRPTVTIGGSDGSKTTIPGAAVPQSAKK